jgi:hypothetical protein
VVGLTRAQGLDQHVEVVVADLRVVHVPVAVVVVRDEGGDLVGGERAEVGQRRQGHGDGLSA